MPEVPDVTMRITRLNLASMLSFGPKGVALDLGALNVLIGPNGSGKSNVIEALGLLQSLSTDLSVPIREGGGIREWGWKGKPGCNPSIECEVEHEFASFRHRVEFDPGPVRPRLSLEVITRAERTKTGLSEWREVYRSGDKAEPPAPGRGAIDEQSVIARSTSTDSLWLELMYDEIAIYREWQTGRRSPLRVPQPADLQDRFLLPSGENLCLVLSAMQRDSGAWDAMRSAMSKLYPAFQDLQLITQGGTVQAFVREKGLSSPVPATRLSDGTLRYLALLTVLLHPNPPSLIAIEEPEIGLHPDMIGTLAGLLERASERTQVVVTTHSDLLVSALSHRPEAVVVVERGPAGTELTRLEPARLAAWLKKYSLGELWLKGEIGGSR